MKAKKQTITPPDGQLTLLRSDAHFTSVTFGYSLDKSVLYDIA